MSNSKLWVDFKWGSKRQFSFSANGKFSQTKSIKFTGHTSGKKAFDDVRTFENTDESDNACVLTEGHAIIFFGIAVTYHK